MFYCGSVYDTLQKKYQSERFRFLGLCCVDVLIFRNWKSLEGNLRNSYD